MSRKDENRAFICEQCGHEVLPLTNGSYRNHCPFCLYSKHLDKESGDRQCSCNGLMEPIGLQYNSQKGFQVIHQCLRCGQRRVNRVAERTVQPDDINEILKLL